MQWLVLLISLIGIGFVSFIFIYVIRNSGERVEEYPTIVKSAYGIRRWWFLALIAIGFAATFMSLMPYPILNASVGEEQVINAEGGQWYWKLDKNEVVVNQPVLINITSADVNHGFAIYNEDDRIIAQAQAMPSYVNELRFTFTEPGKYQVLCLEYCGVAHHAMKATITVKGVE